MMLLVGGLLGCRSSSYLLSGEVKGEFLKRSYSHSGIDMPYRIFFPVKKNDKYPLLLFMHGAGERGTDNERQLIHGKKWLEQNNARFPAVVVLPQCPTDDYWSSVDRNTNADGERKFIFNDKPPTAALNTVMHLLDSLLGLPYIDKERLYVTGLSMGGMATWELMWRRPGMIAAAAPICGGVYLPKAPEVAKTSCIRIYHGDKDAVVSPEFSRSIYESLKSMNANVSYTEYKGVEHNSWLNVFQEKDFFEWMFSCRNGRDNNR